MYEHVDASLSKVLLAANNQQGQMACPRKTSGPSKASFGSCATGSFARSAHGFGVPSGRIP